MKNPKPQGQSPSQRSADFNLLYRRPSACGARAFKRAGDAMPIPGRRLPITNLASSPLHCLGNISRLGWTRLSAPGERHGSAAEDICLACGMCCNGVIFADVKLFPDEEIEPLLSSGIPVSRSCSKRKQSGTEPNDAWRFLQPCAGFDGCRCRIYAKRPTYCRQFECLLFKNVLQGAATQTEALRIVRTARRRVDKVRSLLSALGDKDETIALARRFRRVSRRLERSELDEKDARLYGELTLAFHDLNLLLSEAFYPAPLEK